MEEGSGEGSWPLVSEIPQNFLKADERLREGPRGPLQPQEKEEPPDPAGLFPM